MILAMLLAMISTMLAPSWLASADGTLYIAVADGFGARVCRSCPRGAGSSHPQDL